MIPKQLISDSDHINDPICNNSQDKVHGIRKEYYPLTLNI